MRRLPAMVALVAALVTSLHAAGTNEEGGVVVIEAEDFVANITHGNPHQWVFTNTVAGFSDSGYMEALPNDNDVPSNGGSNWLNFTPELRYAVTFTTTATHYVWIRGYAGTGSDDSIHAGIDGTTNTAAGITLSQTNVWQYTTNRTGGVTSRPTVTPSSNGLHTVSLWMREDGMRVDRVVLTTDPNVQPTVGNVFHIPNDLDADLDLTMRNPQSAIYPATRVELYTGNQFQGAGNPGNQLTTGSTIFFKKSTDLTWSSVPMLFYKIGTSSPNDKYYSNAIPANVASAGDTVQYYFKIPYSDHITTFVYGNDAQSLTTEFESVAKASPFSYTVKAPPAGMTPSPTDWRDQNIYQVFTDRFFDGDPSNNMANPDGTLDPAGGDAIHGGDWRGVQQKLDYLKSLGVTAIWISPILRNPLGQYHGYGTMDFYQTDPHWGTFTDLTNMITAAHARGIYVVLDVICNHPSDLIYSPDPNFTNVFRTPPNGYSLQYRDTSRQYPPPFGTNALNPTLSSLFHTNGNIQNFNDQQQVELGELRDLDDFRTETTYIRTNMVNIWQHWISQADLDGFRVDTVKHVDQGFWQFWAPQIHQYATALGKSNFFMFGETLTGDEGLNGSYTGTQAGGNFELDSMHDYPLYFTVNPVFAKANSNTKQIEDHYNNLAANYDPVAQDRLDTFLDNHDQPRFLSSGNANNNTNRLAVALAFLYTSRGLPTLYYGTEQAFNGGVRPANREDMFAGGWESGPSIGDNFNETHPLFQLVAKLNNFRRNYPSLRRGGHRNLWNDSDSAGLFAYSRTNGAEEVFVVFNTAASTNTLPSRATIYSPGTVLVNLLNTNEAITVIAGSQTPSIDVPGTSVKMFIAQSLIKPLDPVVTSQSPVHAAGNAPTASPVVLTFSKPMDTNSVQSAFSITPPVAGAFSWSGTTQMTFTASGDLPVSTTNFLRIATNAVDSVSTNSFSAPFETYFVTAPITNSESSPPSVAINLPVGGSIVDGPLTVSGTAADNILVSKVELQIDSGGWFTVNGTTSWSLLFDTGNFLNGSHLLSVRATDSSGNVSATDSRTVKFSNVPSGYVQRISAGSFSDVTNCDSVVWLKDRAYTVGSFGFVSGSPDYIAGNATVGICFAGEQLYQRERHSATNSSFRYLFDCPEGVYETTLLESETRTNVPNGRVFNVFIQGQQVLTNFDLYVASGNQKDIPLTRVFTNTVTTSQLQLEFAPVISFARASGIQVRRFADVDTDTDGIPDWWTRAYFDHPTGLGGDKSLAGDDADGDGFTNMQEFLAGTDPTDAADALQITGIVNVGPDVQVTWKSTTGRTYQLQRGSSPDSGETWSNIGSSLTAVGTITGQTDVNAATNFPSRFYRVRLVP